MTSVSPLVGSTEGGTILTIGGVNFALKTNQMQVFIGPQSVVCDVLTTTATQLTCRTRKSAYTTKQNIAITQRLQYTATCSDTDTNNACGYAYLTSSTPVLTGFPASTNIKSGETLTFAGSSLTVDSGSPVLSLSTAAGVLVSNTDSATASASQITFTMPAIVHGMTQI